MRAGAEGAGAALAMRLVVRAAEGLEAPRLIPITGAHVDSCLVRVPVPVLSSSDLASIRDGQQQRVE